MYCCIMMLLSEEMIPDTIDDINQRLGYNTQVMNSQYNHKTMIFCSLFLFALYTLLIKLSGDGETLEAKAEGNRQKFAHINTFFYFEQSKYNMREDTIPFLKPLLCQCTYFYNAAR